MHQLITLLCVLKILWKLNGNLDKVLSTVLANKKYPINVNIIIITISYFRDGGSQLSLPSS
jgi:hypothetical protein